jgi:hypothetical protein
MSRISKTNKDINNYGYKFLSGLAYLLSFVLCDALLFFYLDLNFAGAMEIALVRGSLRRAAPEV